MKRRARRAVIGAAALVAVLVAVLVATHWSMVRDHVEAWRFQLTRKTIISTEPCPFIFDSEDLPEGWPGGWGNFYNDLSAGESFLPHDVYRVLEQRFPRRAYVVIRDADPIGQTSAIHHSYRIIEEP